MTPENNNQYPQYRRITSEPRKVIVPEKRIKDSFLYEIFLYLFDFTGRAGIAEFLLVSLVFMIISLTPAIILLLLHLNNLAVFYIKISLLLLFIPSLAIQVRRLHDTGKSAAYLLVSVIPIVGSIFLMILLFLPADDTTNNPYK